MASTQMPADVATEWALERILLAYSIGLVAYLVLIVLRLHAAGVPPLGWRDGSLVLGVLVGLVGLLAHRAPIASVPILASASILLVATGHRFAAEAEVVALLLFFLMALRLAHGLLLAHLRRTVNDVLLGLVGPHRPA